MLSTLIEFVATLDATMKQLQALNVQDNGFDALSISQLRYIDAIHTKGSPTITGLAEFLGVSKASVTVAITKLVKAGYVRKLPSDKDKRVFFISLTERSLVLVRAKEQALQDYGAFVETTLSDLEKQELKRIMGRLITAFHGSEQKSVEKGKI